MPEVKKKRSLMDRLRTSVQDSVQSGTDFMKSADQRREDDRAAREQWHRMQALSPELGQAYDPRSEAQKKSEDEASILQAARKAAEDKTSGNASPSAYEPNEDDADEPEIKLKRRRLLVGNK